MVEEEDQAEEAEVEEGLVAHPPTMTDAVTMEEVLGDTMLPFNPIISSSNNSNNNNNSTTNPCSNRSEVHPLCTIQVSSHRQLAKCSISKCHRT